MGNVPSRSWPIKRLPDQFGAPTNAQVGRVQDLVRPHPLNDATSAADILADAVFYIDAQEHAAAGANAKTVRNRGWGGSVLNARCGSTSVPDTNDPKFLAAEQSAYVYLPGVTGNYLSVADENVLDITGDLDVRFYIALDDWTPASQNAILGKWSGTGNQKSWGLDVKTNGRFEFYWSANGSTNTGTVSSSVAPTVSDGQALWGRVTFDVDNGASGNDVKFWTSADGVSWTQLGTTVTTAGTTSIFASTAQFRVGGVVTSGETIALKAFCTQVLNGIDGTTVLNVDTSVLTTGSATSFTATTGQTVTINRSTSGRKTVVVPDRSRSGGCWLFGTDDQIIVPGSATGSRMLDFGPRDPFTVLACVRIWATPTSFSAMVSKYDAVLVQGYLLRTQVGSDFYAGIFRDNNNNAQTPLITYSYGANNVLAFTRDVTDSRLRQYSPTTSTISNNTSSSIGSLANVYPLSIARNAFGAQYMDMEVMAVAIFRRALTAAEIATITTDFQRRYA